MTEDFELRSSPDTFLALRCGGCGSVFLSLVPSGDSDGRYVVPPGSLHRTPPWRIVPGGARVLDLGPGVDPDQLQRLSKQHAPYDLARLDLTLEYAPDPVATLQAVHAALRPGGHAIVLLNNLRSPAFAWFGGRHWGGYDTPRQRRVITLDGLARLARAADLELAEVAGVADPGPWMRSLHRWGTDWGAPAWLCRRFSPNALVAPVLFRAVEVALRRSGRAAFLLATLRRPEAPAP